MLLRKSHWRHGWCVCAQHRVLPRRRVLAGAGPVLRPRSGDPLLGVLRYFAVALMTFVRCGAAGAQVEELSQEGFGVVDPFLEEIQVREIAVCASASSL